MQKSTPQPAQKSTTSMNMNVCQLSVSQHISSMIVPVYLSHASCPGQRKLVYAMLDSQSDSSFIIDQTLNDFNIRTEGTVINLSTMNATLPSCVAKLMDLKCKVMVVSRTFHCQHSTLAPNSQVIDHTFPQQTSATDHLKPIANKLLPLQNVEIGLLLGYDVSYVHQPQEIVSSRID